MRALRSALGLAVLLAAACNKNDGDATASAPAVDPGPPAIHSAQRPAGCTPFMLLLAAKQGVSIETAAEGALFVPAIVGCESDLVQLPAAQEAAIVEALTREVERDIGAAAVHHRELTFRQRMAVAVNSALGADVTRDVYLSDFFYWEKNRRPPESRRSE